jgi:hypothetical protein
VVGREPPERAGQLIEIAAEQPFPARRDELGHAAARAGDDGHPGQPGLERGEPERLTRGRRQEDVRAGQYLPYSVPIQPAGQPHPAGQVVPPDEPHHARARRAVAHDGRAQRHRRRHPPARRDQEPQQPDRLLARRQPADRHDMDAVPPRPPGSGRHRPPPRRLDPVAHHLHRDSAPHHGAYRSGRRLAHGGDDHP